ncbi:hypothetical protein Lal_00019650, partial [Lupinus albus]
TITSPEHNLQLSWYCALQRATLLKISKGSTTGEPGTESSPHFFCARFFVIKNAGFKNLRMSDYPSPTLHVQPESGVLWSVRDLRDAEGLLGVIS